MFLFFSLLHLSLDILGANASALSLKRLHHEVALEGLTYEQVNKTKQNFKDKKTWACNLRSCLQSYLKFEIFPSMYFKTLVRSQNTLIMI